jgi:hypothetical protein
VQLALDAARATGAALVGVDLVPTPDGEFAILELNGAVEFTVEYRRHGDVFRETALELARAALDEGVGARPESDDPVFV